MAFLKQENSNFKKALFFTSGKTNESLLIFPQALIRAPTGPSSFSTSPSEAGVKMVSLVVKIAT